jgi:YhcG PDDEXK nuclease domain
MMPREAAIIRDLEAFLVELGGDFAFLARQKRITVDGEDFYIDLLFYHRRLRRLVVIDLKLGRFAPGDLGQMEFSLRWLKKHEMRPGEEAPLGLILCAEKSDERVEVFELESRGVRIAEYLTELPPRDLLERKLHDAVRLARERLGEKPEPTKRLPVPKAAGSSREVLSGRQRIRTMNGGRIFPADLRLWLSPSLDGELSQRAVAENFGAYAGEALRLPPDAAPPEMALLAELRRRVFRG